MPGMSSGPSTDMLNCAMEPYTDRTPPSPPPRTWANDPNAPSQPDWAPPAVGYEATTAICETLVVSPPATPTLDGDVNPVWGILGWLFPLPSLEDWARLRAGAWFPNVRGRNIDEQFWAPPPSQ